MESEGNGNVLIRRVYDSAYDSVFRFSLGHKPCYDSDSDTDSVANENQTLRHSGILVTAVDFGWSSPGLST